MPPGRPSRVGRPVAFCPTSPGKRYGCSDRPQTAVGAIGTDLGLDWGGNWKTIQDEPHFQLRPRWAADMTERDMLAELRSRKDLGKAVRLSWSA